MNEWKHLNELNAIMVKFPINWQSVSCTVWPLVDPGHSRSQQSDTCDMSESKVIACIDCSFTVSVVTVLVLLLLLWTKTRSLPHPHPAMSHVEQLSASGSSRILGMRQPCPLGKSVCMLCQTCMRIIPPTLTCTEYFLQSEHPAYIHCKILQVTITIHHTSYCLVHTYPLLSPLLWKVQPSLEPSLEGGGATESSGRIIARRPISFFS